jgi:hypothetical protein
MIWFDNLLRVLAQEPNFAAISGIFSGPNTRRARMIINSNSNPLKFLIKFIEFLVGYIFFRIVSRPL